MSYWANALFSLSWNGSSCHTAGKMGITFMRKKCSIEVVLFVGHYNRSLNISALNFSVRFTELPYSSGKPGFDYPLFFPSQSIRIARNLLLIIVK